MIDVLEREVVLQFKDFPKTSGMLVVREGARTAADCSRCFCCRQTQRKQFQFDKTGLSILFLFMIIIIGNPFKKRFPIIIIVNRVDENYDILEDRFYGFQ